MTEFTNDNKYFAAKESKTTANAVLGKANSWFNAMESNAYLEKVRRSWAAYHGAYYSDVGGGHQITFGGEQGELSNIAVNDFRNLAQHTHVMVTSARPTLEARATNTDYKSLVQTKLANGLLDYYMREKRLERVLKKAVEYAIVMGSGYIKMEWNGTTGEVYDYNEATDTREYEGDIEYTNLSIFDVVFDSTKETDNHDWLMVRSWRNKYDLAAKYPEMKDEIEGLSTKSDNSRYRFDITEYGETDDVPVYEFYHKRTDAMKDGRFLMFLSEELVLQDVPMPYRNLPVHRIAPADILGTSYGYTSLFDILPIQDAMNMLHSTILTNQSTFGVQNIYVPRGADIAINQLAGGLNILEGNSTAGKPEAMNLTQTPPEIFKFLDLLKSAAETVSGINSVTRGDPPSHLESGTALALIQSMALQFMSGLQQSYIELMEDVGTDTINMLKDFASVPRVAAISGLSNKTYMKEFTGDDLHTVNRVIVDVGNALSRTTAGRVSMAESMMQMGLITTPEQYLMVISTGKLETMTDTDQDVLFLIKSENEYLVEGKEVIALATDKHSLHVKHHQSVLSDPDLRQDAELVSRTLAHIEEHIMLASTTDPNLLQMIGEQPIMQQPLMGADGAPIPPPPVPMGEAMAAPQAEGAQATPENANANMPQPAAPPGEFANLPTDPAQMVQN